MFNRIVLFSSISLLFFAGQNAQANQQYDGLYGGAKLGAGTSVHGIKGGGHSYDGLIGLSGAELSFFTGYGITKDDLYAGLEFDLAKSNVDFKYSSGSDGVELSHDWSASLSGRIGMISEDDTLVYAKLGAGRGAIDGGYVDFPTKYGVDEQLTFVNVGVGFESILSKNLRFRGELEIKDYDSFTLNFTGTPINLSPFYVAASLGLVYSFGESASSSKVARLRYNKSSSKQFDGFYIAPHIGYEYAPISINPGYKELPSSGASFGLDIGWGMLYHGWFLGAEISADKEEVVSNVESGSSEYDLLELSNTRRISAKLGYPLSTSTMVYGVAGRTKSKFEINDDTSRLYSEDVDGWHAGIGVESVMAGGFSLTGRYIYTDYDKLGNPFSNYGLEKSSFQAGVLFRF